MPKKPKPKAATPASHQQVLLLAGEVAGIYRGIAGELLSSAHTLEKAQRPEDPYPAVSPARFAYATSRAAILHHELDKVLHGRAEVRAKRKR